MATDVYLVESEGLMLDLILWRRYRRATPGLVEKVLDLNPGLAEQGPVIAVGTTIRIPIEAQPIPVRRDAVRLWD